MSGICSVWEGNYFVKFNQKNALLGCGFVALALLCLLVVLAGRFVSWELVLEMVRVLFKSNDETTCTYE